MSTPHGPERRAQALRRSGAAGIHDDRPTRTEAVRAALADQGVTEEVTMSTHPTDDPRRAATGAIEALNHIDDPAVYDGAHILDAIEAAGLRVVWADPKTPGDLTIADLERRYGELRYQTAALVAEADGLRAAFGAHRCTLRTDVTEALDAARALVAIGDNPAVCGPGPLWAEAIEKLRAVLREGSEAAETESLAARLSQLGSSGHVRVRLDHSSADDPEAAEEVVVARDTARGTGPTAHTDGPR